MSSDGLPLELLAGLPGEFGSVIGNAEKMYRRNSSQIAVGELDRVDWHRICNPLGPRNLGTFQAKRLLREKDELDSLTSVAGSREQTQEFSLDAGIRMI